MAASSSVSFGFSKTKSKSAVSTSNSASLFESKQHLGDDAEDRDYLQDASEVRRPKKKPEKAELVIPCLGNRINLLPKDKDDLSTQAEQEILKDAEKWQQDRDNEDENGEVRKDVEIPMKNDNDDEQDQEDRTKESSLEDYDSVPVSGFGMGMLRGMGFKAGEGIGGFKKLDVKCLDPVVRPKGLGLGAVRPGDANNKSKDSSSKAKDGDEELVLKKGAYVKVVSGANRDMYGQVEGMDEDAARVFVKLAVGSKTASISENAVMVVSSKEYKKYSKVINRDLYDEYEEKQKRREVEWDNGREERAGDEKKKKRKRSRSRSRSPKNKKSYKRSPSPARDDWVRPGLKVRFVDSKYKDGRYYKSKMVVDDVVSLGRCTCRSESGAYLEGVKPKQLETVIPKKEGAVVMVLYGKFKGRLAEVLGRDKAKCVAAVQILPDREEAAKLDFDDICEFAGDVPEF